MIKFSIFAVWNVDWMSDILIISTKGNSRLSLSPDRTQTTGTVKIKRSQCKISMLILKVKTHYTIYIFWLFIRPIPCSVFWNCAFGKLSFCNPLTSFKWAEKFKFYVKVLQNSKPKGQVTFRILTIAKTKKSVSISVKFFEILSDDKRKNSTKLNFKFIQPVAKSILGPSNIEYNGSHNSNAQQNFKTISVHEIDSLAP